MVSEAAAIIDTRRGARLFVALPLPHHQDNIHLNCLQIYLGKLSYRMQACMY